MAITLTQELTINNFFEKAKSITIFKNGKSRIFKENEKEFKNIIQQFTEQTQNSVEMPAYAVSLHNETIKAINDGLWIQFNFEQELDYIKLKAKVEESLNNYTLGKKVIIALGNTELKKEEYEELMSLLGEREIYVVATNEKTLEVLSSIDSHNVIVINFYDKLKEHENYLLWDKIHLSKEGNKALEDMLISILKS